MFILGYSIQLFAQNANDVSTSKKSAKAPPRHYSFGEKIPDIAISNILNYKTTSAKLSDFKGKIVILDYWATWCGSCISSFPKDEELQKNFGDKIQFLLITKESDRLVKDFIAKSKKYKRFYPHLAFVAGDTAFNKLVEIPSLPTWAFIDETGILRSITTDRDSLTVKNIQGMIEKRYPNIAHPHTQVGPEVLKTQPRISIMEPLFVNGNGNDSGKIVSYSLISKFDKNIPKYTVGPSTDKKRQRNIVYLGGYPVKLLYQYAFFDDLQVNNYKHLYEYIPNTRVLLELKDTSEVVIMLNHTINTGKLFTYQLIVPETTLPQTRNYMKQDLAKYFKYNVRVEKRRVNCLVLTSQDTTLLFSKGGKPSPLVKEDPFNLTITNEPFWFLQGYFNYATWYGFPFIDETGYKGNTDISIQANLIDWKSVAKALEKYKLTLKLEERNINMLVIGDAPDPMSMAKN